EVLRLLRLERPEARDRVQYAVAPRAQVDVRPPDLEPRAVGVVLELVQRREGGPAVFELTRIEPRLVGHVQDHETVVRAGPDELRGRTEGSPPRVELAVAALADTPPVEEQGREAWRCAGRRCRRDGSRRGSGAWARQRVDLELTNALAADAD